MSDLPKPNVPPSSPSRRHFLGIAAAAARRLRAVPLGASALSMLGARDAGAHGFDRPAHHQPHHHHHHQQQQHGSSAGGGYRRSETPHWHSGSWTGTSYTSSSPRVRCFIRGTRILTVDGDVPVENLVVASEVATAHGPRPVKWIGRQTLRRNRSMVWHPSVLPVCISQFAIDDLTPGRDVYLSQDHAVFIDGVLIPVKHLVNGQSIRIDKTVLQSETIEYLHVELETHEVIFADRLPVESFLYSGGVVAWDNLEDYHRLYGSHRAVAPVAAYHSYEGGRDEVRGLIRLAASRFVDVRDPIQIARDRIAARARRGVA